MDTASLSRALDEALPDIKIFHDLWTVLAEVEQEGDFVVELDGERLRIPPDAPLHVMYKSFRKNVHEYSFTYVAGVAIGDIEDTGTNIFYSDYCFVDLLYNEDAECVTTDWYKDIVKKASQEIREATAQDPTNRLP